MGNRAQSGTSNTSDASIESSDALPLPDELILYILSFVSLHDLFRLMQVSHRWKQLAQDNLLWLSKFKDAWGPRYIMLAQRLSSAAAYKLQRYGNFLQAQSDPTSFSWRGLYLQRQMIESQWRKARFSQTIINTEPFAVRGVGLSCLENQNLVITTGPFGVRVYYPTTHERLLLSADRLNGRAVSVHPTDPRTLFITAHDQAPKAQYLYLWDGSQRKLVGGYFADAGATCCHWEPAISRLACGTLSGSVLLYDSEAHMGSIIDESAATNTAINNAAAGTNTTPTVNDDALVFSEPAPAPMQQPPPWHLGLVVPPVAPAELKINSNNSAPIVRGIHFLHDSHLMVTGCEDSTVCVWDMRLVAMAPVRAEPERPALAQTATPAGLERRIVGAHRNNTIIQSVQMDERYVFSAAQDGTISCFDLRVNKLLVSLRTHRGGVKTLHYDRWQRRMMSACFAGDVALWNTYKLTTGSLRTSKSWFEPEGLYSLKSAKGAWCIRADDLMVCVGTQAGTTLALFVKLKEKTIVKCLKIAGENNNPNDTSGHTEQ